MLHANVSLADYRNQSAPTNLFLTTISVLSFGLNEKNFFPSKYTIDRDLENCEQFLNISQQMRIFGAPKCLSLLLGPHSKSYSATGIHNIRRFLV